LLTFRAETEI